VKAPEKKQGFELSLRILLITPVLLAIGSFLALGVSDLPPKPAVLVPAISGMLISTFFAVGITSLAYYRLIVSPSSRTPGSYFLTGAGTLLSLVAIVVAVSMG
jgi:hypothetical protein